MLRFAGTFALKGKKAKKEAPRRKAREAPFYENMALTFPAAFRVVVNGNIATWRCWCKCPGFVRVFYLVPFLGFLVPFYGLFLRPGVLHSVPLLFPVYGVFEGFQGIPAHSCHFVKAPRLVFK